MEKMMVAIVICFLCGFANSQILSVPEACTGMTCLNAGVVEAGDEFGCRCYCTENFTGLMCETEIQVSEWPNGPYATPMSIYGCPETVGHGWRTGHINMTFLLPLSLNSSSTFSHDNESSELLGPASSKVMQINFCYKQYKNQPLDEEEVKWPSGNYTIFRANGSCPLGFKADTLKSELPPLLRAEIDGFTADFDVRRKYEDENATSDKVTKTSVIEVNVCHRLYTNETVWNNWTAPFILLKDKIKETKMDLCPNFPSFDVLQETSPFGWRYCSYRRDRNTDFDEALDGASTNGDESSGIVGVKEITTSWWTHSVADWGDYEFMWMAHPLEFEDVIDQDPWLLLDLEQTIDLHYIRIFHRRIDAGTILLKSKRALMIEVSHYKWAFLSKGSLRCPGQMRLGQHEGIEQTCLHSARYVAVVMRHRFKMDFFYILKGVDVVGRGIGCGKELGMRDGGIRDIQITASSGSEPNSGRPQLSGWCALAKDADPYLQVDMLVATVVEGITIFNWERRIPSTTSFEYKPEIVRGGTRNFRIDFGFDVNMLHNYTDLYGKVKTFYLDLSLPYDHPQTFRLQHPILATIVRIHPTDELEPCLRIELIGCRKRRLTTLQCQNNRFPRQEEQRMLFISPLSYATPTSEKQSLNHSDSNCTHMTETCDCTAVVNNGSKCDTDAHKLGNKGSGNMTSLRLCLDEPSDVVPTMETGGLQLSLNKPGIITSYGYPLYYDSGYIDKWTIDLGGKRYILLAFSDISLNIHETGDAQLKSYQVYSQPKDKIVLRRKVWGKDRRNPYLKTLPQVVINSHYNGHQLIYFSRSDAIELLFHSCVAEVNSVIGKGFRAILKRLDIPSCMVTSKTGHYSCLKENNAATLSSNSFLLSGDMDSREEVWYMNGHNKYLNLTFTDFDVACQGWSVLEVVLGGSPSRQYCNLQRPARNIIADDGSATVRFAMTRYQARQRQGFRAIVQTLVINNYIGDMDITISRKAVTGIEREGFLAAFVSFDACVTAFEKCYRFYGPRGYQQGSLNAWPKAVLEQQCSDMSSPETQLVTIRSKAENDFIIYQFQHRMIFNVRGLSSDRSLVFYTYIGLERVQNLRKVWREQWVDGSPVTYTAWAPEQPKDVYQKKCTRMALNSLYDTNTWQTTSCDEPLASFFVCEFKNRTVIEDSLHKQLVQGNDTEVGVGYFRCRSGDMISTFYVCDNISDCLDGSDEVNCSSHSGDLDVCPDGYFLCKSGDCVNISQCCDFKADCPDASDEYCDFPACSDQFECANKQCIPKTSRCDLKPDCYDGSDEIDCDTCEESTMFRCNDNKCIPERLLCDGFADCSNSEDERCEPSDRLSCLNWWKAGFRNSGMYSIDSEDHIECDFDRKGVIYTKYHNIGILDRQLSSGTVRKITVIYQNKDAVKKMVNIIQPCKQSVVQTCPPPKDMIADIDNDTSHWDSRSCHCVRTTEGGNISTIEACSQMTRKLSAKNGKHWLASVSQISFIEGMPFTRLQLKTSTNLTNIRFKFEPIICEEAAPDSSHDLLCARGKPVDVGRKCILEYDDYNFPLGCRDLTHLQECEDFDCPSEYVKCPRSFCLPIAFLCDGVRHCPDGQDELNCWCGPMPSPARVVIMFDRKYLEETAVGIATELYQQGSGSNPPVIDLLQETPKIPPFLLLGRRRRNAAYYTTTLIHKTFHPTNTNQEVKRFRLDQDHIGEVMPNLIQGRTLPPDEGGLRVPTVVIVLAFNELSIQLKDLMNFNHSIVEGIELLILAGAASDSILDTRSRFMLPAGAKYKAVKDWEFVRPSMLDIFSSFCPEPEFPVCRGYYRCRASRICLPRSAVCDSRTQCPHGDDEKFCDFVCPANCVCNVYTVDCSGGRFQRDVLQTIPRTTRALDLNSNNITSNPELRAVDLRLLVKLNMSHCELTAVPDRFLRSMVNLLNLDLSFNHIMEFKRYDFATYSRLKVLDISGNNDLLSISSLAFSELVNLKSLAITGTKLKSLTEHTFSGMRLTSLDLSGNQIDTIDEKAFENLHVQKLNLENNPISYFSRDMFNGITSMTVLKTSSFKFCCLDHLKDVDCYPYRDEFSSCEDLMRNDALRFLLWIIGVCALVGNALSLLYRLKFDRKRLKLGYGIFVTNLAVSDFLMGVYLLIIAVADSSFRGQYILHDDWWRQSGWCSFAGVISTVSSEASILFMCLITIDRIIVIKFPFGDMRFKTKSALAMAAIVWIIVLMLATIPLWFTSYFKKQFYSRSGVCLAMPLTRDRPPGWEYSSGLFIGFNLLTFLLIAFGQWMIYREIHASSRKTGRTTKRKQDLAVARNLLLVVSTDFLCWFPIGVMGIMASCGYVIPGEVYAWSAVLILPINSALNPFLYTFSAIIGSKKFKPSVEEQSRTMTFSKASVNKINEIWINELFFPKKKAGSTYLPLSSYVRDKRLAVKEVLVIAAKITKAIRRLHFVEMIHGDLSFDDIYVIQTNKVTKVTIEAAPKCVSRQTEKKKDMEQLGNIIRQLSVSVDQSITVCH